MIHSILGLMLITLLVGSQKSMTNEISLEESTIQLKEELVEDKGTTNQMNKDSSNNEWFQQEDLTQLKEALVEEQDVTVQVENQNLNSSETILEESTVQLEEDVKHKDIIKQLTNEEIHDVNVYLSQLSSMKLETYQQQQPDHEVLLNVGFWLNVFDGMKDVTFKEVDGQYYDVFNYEEFNEKINRYFDYKLEKKGTDEWLFLNNKYYHPSFPTGYALDTVTQLESVVDNRDSSFLIEASIYQFEPSMEIDLYSQYLQPKLTWTSSMESKLIGSVTATINYSKRLNHYVIEEYQANYINNNQVVDETNTFTIAQAINYAKEHYGENEDTLYFIGDQVEYDEHGKKYYTITLKSLSMIEAGESGILFSTRVYEDGIVVE